MCKLQIENRHGFGQRLAVVVVAALLAATHGAEVVTPGNPAKELFAKNCAVCHGADGTAQTPLAKRLGVKDLSQSKLTDAQIKQQISEGRQENQSASKMPAFKEKLTRQEIESLVPVVKDFRGANSQENLGPKDRK
jgi:mono/diheme cytochrome c family protein